MQRVFGIGLNKTGTTTLGQCARLLGYRCTSANRELLEDITLRGDYSRVRSAVTPYDFFEDWPWPLIYRKLDAMFPGSKFILTVRESDEKWLSSLKKHAMWTHPVRHCRKLAYGYAYPHDHAQAHLDFYNRHNRSVRSHFAGRETQLLELCWETGSGWPELCDFLRVDYPDVALPHENRARTPIRRVDRYVANSLMRLFS